MNVFLGSLSEWIQCYLVVGMASSGFMFLIHQIFPEGFYDDEGDVYDGVAFYVLLALLGPFVIVVLLSAIAKEVLPGMASSMSSMRVVRGLRKAEAFCCYIFECLLNDRFGGWTDSVLEKLGTFFRAAGPMTVPVLVLAIVAATTMSYDPTMLAAVVFPINDFYYRLG